MGSWVDVVLNLMQLLHETAAYIVFLVVFIVGARMKAEWTTSIRSLATLVLTFSFVRLAQLGKIDPKDVMLIISLVYNFYFLVKQRHNGNGVEAPK